MVRVRPSLIEGTVVAPPSKSYSHRVLAVSLLAERPSHLRNVSTARDVMATVNAIKSMGAELLVNERKGEGVVNLEVDPPPLPLTPPDILDCGGSGTTIRFFASIATLTERGYTVLTGNESLRRRPMGPLIEAINQLGSWAVSSRMNGLPPLIVRGGGLRGGRAAIPGNVSSQFFSSLMISGTLSERGVKLKPTGELVSKPYILMTSSILERAGSVVEVGEEIVVEPVRPNKLDITVPGDSGLAAPLMAMASITGGRLVIEGLDPSLPQADSLIIEVLRAFGVTVAIKGDKVIVEGKPTVPAELDLRDAPDLLPIAAVLAAYAEGKTVIRGVAHARVKESDRITNTREELSKVGIEVKELEDGLVIEGTVRKGAVLESHKDHRMFMALTALAAGAPEPCEVWGEEWVADSYPNFLRDAERLGLVIEG